MVLEKTLESPLDCKEIKPVNPEGYKSWMWKDWCWSWNYNTLDTWWEELTHWKRPWCWERLKAGGEGDDRGWDGWMASLTWWTWVWASSGSRWWTGKPGMMLSMGSQRVGHDWVTEMNWIEQRSMCAYSVVSDSWQPPGLHPASLLCPWNFPGKNMRVGCHFLLQGIFLTQGLNPSLLCLLHWQVDSLPVSHLGKISIGWEFKALILQVS